MMDDGEHKSKDKEENDCSTSGITHSTADQFIFEKQPESGLRARNFMSTIWGSSEMEDTRPSKTDEEYKNDIFHPSGSKETFPKKDKSRLRELFSDQNIHHKVRSHETSHLPGLHLKRSSDTDRPERFVSDRHPSKNTAKNEFGSLMQSSNETSVNLGSQSVVREDGDSRYPVILSSDNNQDIPEFATKSQPLERADISLTKNEQMLTKEASNLSLCNRLETTKGGSSGGLKDWKIQEIIDAFDRKYPDEDNESSLYDSVKDHGVSSSLKDSFEGLELFCSLHGFQMKDSSENGNCMFQAIHDQLRINGDFRFTISSLRQLAVEYLIENPISQDGTHLSCFLENDWTTYLSRMAQSCQWGDHLVLQSLGQLLKRKIVVFNANKDTIRQYEIIPDILDETRIEILYLGHVGELHYSSLRPVGWEDTWVSKAKKNRQSKSSKKLHFGNSLERVTEESILCDPMTIDHISEVPLFHFNFILKRLIDSNDICQMMIPKKLYGREDNTCVATAGGKSDGTDVFLKHANPQKHRAEYWQRYDNESPLMIFYPKDYEAVCDGGNHELPRNQVRAEIDKSPPGYCFLRCFHRAQNYLSAHGVSMPEHTRVDRRKALAGYICPKWPMCAREWLERETTSGWPPKPLKRHIAATGCIIAKIHHPQSATPEYEWQFIFNEAEKVLFLKGLSEAQRYVYDVFKIMVDFTTKHLKCQLTTYHIKNVFLFACEEIDQSNFCESVGGCLLYITEMLSSSLKRKHLPNYFIKENNMINTMEDEDIRRIKETLDGLRIFPIQSLVFLASGRGYYTAWASEIVENDIECYKKDHDLERPIANVFLPIMIRLARKFAAEFREDKASHTLIEVHNMLTAISQSKQGTSLHVPDLTDLVQEILPNLEQLRRCLMLHKIQKQTGINMFPRDFGTKLCEDFTGGVDIGGYGQMPLPKFCPDSIPECIYHEAVFLNGIGATLHNRENDYVSAMPYFMAAIDHLVKGTKRDLKAITSDLYANTLKHQTYFLEQVSLYDRLSLMCFKNLLISVTITGEIEKLQNRMSCLEETVKRLQTAEGLEFVMSVWEKLGQPGRAVEFYESFYEHSKP